MTLKSLSALAIASIFILSTASVEARPQFELGESRRDDRGDRGDRGGRGDRDDRGDRGGGRHEDRRPDHGGGYGPGNPRPPHHGGGHGGPGYPHPRPRPPAPPHYPNPPRPPSYPPNYGQVVVQLPINQRMYNGTSINLTRFIDQNYHRGMRVVAVEVNARSVFNNAILDLFVNGYANTSIYVSPYGQIYSLFPGSVILGYGSDLVLANRGDVDVFGITLRLSR